MTTPRTFNWQIAAPPTDLPAYLSGADLRQWVATASSATVTACRPSPVPGATTGAGLPGGVVEGWNGDQFSYSGAAMDQTRGELNFTCGGGHGDYPGNECYVVGLRVHAPAVRRITPSSPDSVIEQRMYQTRVNRNPSVPIYSYGDMAAGEGAKNTDNIPHSIHNTTELQHVNGRVWFTGQSSTARDSMSIPVCFSFDREALGAAAAPCSYATAQTLWRWHGLWHPNNGTFGGFGVSAVDLQRNRVWGFEDANLGRAWCINTATGVAENARLVVQATQPSFHFAQWACCAPGLGIVVVGRSGGRNVVVWDVSSPTLNSSTLNRLGEKTLDAQGATIYFDERVNQTEFAPSGNAVYHAASQSILWFEGRRKASGKIIQMLIPTSGGVYNHAGTWVVRELTTSVLGGGSLPTPTSNSTYSRFNILNDVGNGEPVLVYAPGVNQPVYVCRIGDIS